MIGIVSLIARAMSGFAGRIVRNPLAVLIVVLAISCIWLWHGRDAARDLAELRKVQAAGWQARFRDQKAEMLKFTAMVRQARIDAARLDQANVARVQRQWGATLQEVTNDYQADLAAARARLAGRLQSGAGTPGGGDPSRGGASQLSAVSAVSGGAVRPGGAAIVDGADLDACTVSVVRLEHLVAAWERAAAIDVNSGL